MRPRCFVLPVVMLLLPALSPAQRLQDARVSVSARVALDSLGANSTDRSNVLRVRTVTVVLGVGAGALAGAYVGNAFVDCGEDCFVPAGALLGAVVGSFIGAAAGAAMPSFNSVCRFKARFDHGLGGALIGGLVGGLTAAAAKDHAYVQFGAVVGFMSFGAAAMQGKC